MAIAYGRGAVNSASTTTTIAATVVINAGETALVWVYFASTKTLTGISGGGAYTQRAALTNGTHRMELWSTGAGSATAATTVTATLTGAAADSGIVVEVYTGAVSLGNTNAVALTTNPNVAVTTQDTSNWVVVGCSYPNALALPTTASPGTFRHSDQDVSVSAFTGDNTSVSPASVAVGFTYSGTGGVGLGMELRTAVASAKKFVSATGQTFPILAWFPGSGHIRDSQTWPNGDGF